MKKILLSILALSFSSLAVANDAAKIALVKKFYETPYDGLYTLSKKSLTDNLRKRLSSFMPQFDDDLDCDRACEADKKTVGAHHLRHNLYSYMYNAAQDDNPPKKMSVNAKGQVVVNLNYGKATFTLVKQGNGYKISAIN